MECIDWCLIIVVVKAGVLKTAPFVFGIPLQPCLILFSSFKGVTLPLETKYCALIIKVLPPLPPPNALNDLDYSQY
jgi:hypothetical protein